MNEKICSSTMPELPPAEYTALLAGSLRLNRFGEWFHNGEPFTNHRVASLFLRSVRWAPERSCFVVRIGKQQATFSVEDTALFVEGVEVQGDGLLIAMISDATVQQISPQQLRVGAEDQFYLLVHNCTARARLSRAVHQQLLGCVDEDGSLRFGTQHITPPRLTEQLP